MDRKLLIWVVIISVILTVVSDCSFAEQPIIKISEVKRAYLFLTEKNGEIEGYLVFYNMENQQCAVNAAYDFGILPATLYCGNKYAHIFEKMLYITPRDFSFFSAKNGDIFYGYIIEPFSIGLVKRRLTVYFQWEGLLVSTTVRLRNTQWY